MEGVEGANKDDRRERCHRFNVTSLSIWPATGVSPVLRHLERYTALKLAYFLSGASVSSFSDRGSSVARQSNRLDASKNCWITFVLNTPAPAVQQKRPQGNAACARVSQPRR